MQVDRLGEIVSQGPIALFTAVDHSTRAQGFDESQHSCCGCWVH